MTPTFEIVPYKAMDGCYVRASWPDGHAVDIEDNSSPGPAFLTEDEAAHWIETQSVAWLSRLNSN